jgi:hypothetical protein
MLNALILRDMATAPQTALDKKAVLQKQIDALQGQLQALDQEAIHELKLKLSDARKTVRDFEDQLATLTGRPSDAPKVRRQRRPSITDDALKDQIIKAMATFGKEGMNAKQLADKLNQDALRVRKFIKDNPKVLKRQGAGPGTKFYLP